MDRPPRKDWRTRKQKLADMAKQTDQSPQEAAIAAAKLREMDAPRSTSLSSSGRFYIDGVLVGEIDSIDIKFSFDFAPMEQSMRAASAAMADFDRAWKRAEAVRQAARARDET